MLPYHSRSVLKHDDAIRLQPKVKLGADIGRMRLGKMRRQHRIARSHMAAVMRAEESASGDAAAAEGNGRPIGIGAAEMLRSDAERHIAAGDR